MGLQATNIQPTLHTPPSPTYRIHEYTRPFPCPPAPPPASRLSYFPEPDLPPLTVSEDFIEQVKVSYCGGRGRSVTNAP